MSDTIKATLVVLILTRGAYRITLGDRDLAVAALEKGERTVALDVYPLDGDDPPIRMTIVTNHLVSFYEEGDAGAMDAKPTLEVANVVTLRRAGNTFSGRFACQMTQLPPKIRTL